MRPWGGLPRSCLRDHKRSRRASFSLSSRGGFDEIMAENLNRRTVLRPGNWGQGPQYSMKGSVRTMALLSPVIGNALCPNN